MTVASVLGITDPWTRWNSYAGAYWANLLDADVCGAIARSGGVDMVTEHFMLSFLRTPELVALTRESYQRIMKPGGTLLVAASFDDPDQHGEFVALHEELGFRYEAEREARVWDPYDLTPGVIAAYLEQGAEIELRSPNRLMAFRR